MIGLLRTYLRPYRGQISIVLVLLLIQALANLYLPDLNADIINRGVILGDTNFIVSTGAVMLVVTLLLGVCAIISVYLSARIAMGFGRDVRLALFTKVETFSQVEMNHFGPASLITRNPTQARWLGGIGIAMSVLDLGVSLCYALVFFAALGTTTTINSPGITLSIGVATSARTSNAGGRRDCPG